MLKVVIRLVFTIQFSFCFLLHYNYCSFYCPIQFPFHITFTWYFLKFSSTSSFLIPYSAATINVLHSIPTFPSCSRVTHPSLCGAFFCCNCTSLSTRGSVFAIVICQRRQHLLACGWDLHLIVKIYTRKCNNSIGNCTNAFRLIRNCDYLSNVFVQPMIYCPQPLANSDISGKMDVIF